MQSEKAITFLGFVVGASPGVTDQVVHLRGKFRRKFWTLLHLRRAVLQGRQNVQNLHGNNTTNAGSKRGCPPPHVDKYPNTTAGENAEECPEDLLRELHIIQGNARGPGIQNPINYRLFHLLM